MCNLKCEILVSTRQLIYSLVVLVTYLHTYDIAKSNSNLLDFSQTDSLMITCHQSTIIIMYYSSQMK